MATEHEQYQPKLEPAEQRKAVEEEKLSAAATHLATAVLHHHLPEAPWRPMAAALGYSVGFLVVILGSQQLYTENTLTPIVPLMAEPTGRMLRKLLRLWGRSARGVPIR